MYSIYHLNMNTDQTLFAAVRVKRISSIQHLNACAIHGRRKDPSALRRCDMGKTKDNLSESDYSDDPLDLVKAFKQRKASSGAKEYGKAPLGLHALCIISPDAIAKHGDVHDPNNPFNVKMFREAKVWAEKEFGKGSVIASRMDMDERGSGVVDLFIVPVREMVMRGKTKPIISVNKALDEISSKYNRRKSYQALQDCWSEHAKVLNPDIQRGKEKTVIGDDYQPPDIFSRKIEQVLSVARKRADNIITRAKNKAKAIREDSEKRGKRWRDFLNGVIGKDPEKRAHEQGLKEGRSSRQNEVDRANDRAVRMEKERDRAREDLKQERDDRAKDFVLPKREHADYAKWKMEQKTKNAPAGPERQRQYGHGFMK